MRRTIAYSIVVGISVTVVLAAALVQGNGECDVDQPNKILDYLFDAENQVFNEDGRFFITGGNNIFEITKNSTGHYQQHPLFSPGPAYFLGMAILNGHLYTAYQAGGKNMIGAAQLTPGTLPVVKPIFELTDFSLPNGMAAFSPLPNTILLADTANLKSSGKLVTLTVNSSDPFSIEKQSIWLASSSMHPNGLKVRGKDVYYSSDNTISSDLVHVAINSDGSAGAVATLYSRSLSIFDDLDLLSSNVLAMCDYLRGSILFIDLSQSPVAVKETSKFSFAEPSSILRTQSPLFSNDQSLVVTVKGIVKIKSGPGNYVATFNSPCDPPNTTAQETEAMRNDNRVHRVHVK